jgi:hypothetical protein
VSFSRISFSLLSGLDYAAAIEMFCNDHVESVLRERVDDRAVRIFRLLRSNTNIEEELLPKMAMLAPKEAKEICYLMLENGYIFSRVMKYLFFHENF